MTAEYGRCIKLRHEDTQKRYRSELIIVSVIAIDRMFAKGSAHLGPLIRPPSTLMTAIVIMVLVWLCITYFFSCIKMEVCISCMFVSVSGGLLNYLREWHKAYPHD